MTGASKPKRIKQRQVAEGDRAALAAAIAGQERVGIIDGVEIDFRHPDLPPEWEALPWWYVSGPSPSNAGILFPTEAAHRFTPEFQEIKGLWADLPLVEVQAGDKISVESVQITLHGGDFDHAGQPSAARKDGAREAPRTGRSASTSDHGDR